MASDNPTEPCADDSRTPAEEDVKVERSVLSQVLHHHPTHLTVPELAREVCDDPDDFAEGDGLARAVRDLTAIGLLRMEGETVVPTLAAIHSDRLFTE